MTMAMVWGILTVTAAAEEARSAQKVAEDEEGGSRGNCSVVHAQNAVGSKLVTTGYDSSWNGWVVMSNIYWKGQYVVVFKPQIPFYNARD